MNITNIYGITFEHPDHGYYYRTVMTKQELHVNSEGSKNFIQQKLDNYNEIVDIELLIQDEIIRI